MKRNWKFSFIVDIRMKLQPTLPPEYAGNAVVIAHAMATTEEVKERPFSYCVEKIQEGINMITDQYSRSLIDWYEMRKEFLQTQHNGFFVTSWLKLGFAEIEFPWGKAKYCCSLGHPMFGVLLPSMNDERTGVSSGVNLLAWMSDVEFKLFGEFFQDIV